MRKHLLLAFVLLSAACNSPWNTSPKTEPADPAPARSQTPARLTADESPESVDSETAAAQQQVEAYVSTFADASDPASAKPGEPPPPVPAIADTSTQRDPAATLAAAPAPAPSSRPADASRVAPPDAVPPAGGVASTAPNLNAPSPLAAPTGSSKIVATPVTPSPSSSAPEHSPAGATDERNAAQRADIPAPAAPRLLSTAVSAAPPTRTSADATPAASPNRPVRPGAGQGVADRIAELERAVADNPNDLEAQFRLRLLQLADGRDAQATAPTPGMTRDIEETVLAVVRVLAAARTGAGRDPAEWANRQLDAIETYAVLVRRQADLLVPRVALCREALSYGVFDEIDPPRFAAGRPTTVLVYVEVANLRDEPTADNHRRTRLSARLSILDRSGQEVWSRVEENMEDVCRNTRRDYFVAIDLNIPTSLNPGRYTLKAAVTDAIGLRTNEGRTEFELFAP